MNRDISMPYCQGSGRPYAGTYGLGSGQGIDLVRPGVSGGQVTMRLVDKIKLREASTARTRAKKPLVVVAVGDPRPRSLHGDGFSFSLRLLFALVSLVVNERTPSAASSNRGRRCHLGKPPPPLQWTLTDRVRGQGEGIQTPSSAPPSWMPPSSSASATRPWRSGCSAPWRKAMRKKSPNRSALSFLLFSPSPTRTTTSHRRGQ